MKRAVLVKITEMDRSDFVLSPAQYAKLCAAQGTEVQVGAEACDGYFDITLADGTVYGAISWYHLDPLE